MHQLEAMSWQFNHLLGPAQANSAAGPSLSLISATSSEEPASSSPAAAPASTSTEQQQQAKKDSDHVSSDTTKAGDDHFMATASHQEGPKSKDVEGQSAKSESGIGLEASDDGSEFFQKFLNIEATSTSSANSKFRQTSSSASFNNLTFQSSASFNNISSIQQDSAATTGLANLDYESQPNRLQTGNNTILGSSTSLTLDHLLPEQQASQQQQQQHLPWSTYSMPIYSMSSSTSTSASTAHQQQPGEQVASYASSDILLNNHHHQKLHEGKQAAFQLGSDSLFTEARPRHDIDDPVDLEISTGPNINGPATTTGLIGSGRTYSSVLDHHRHDNQRNSMFADLLGPDPSSNLLLPSSSSQQHPRQSASNVYQQRQIQNLFGPHQASGFQQQQHFPFGQQQQAANGQFQPRHSSDKGFMSSSASSSAGSGGNSMQLATMNHQKRHQNHHPARSGGNSSKLPPFLTNHHHQQQHPHQMLVGDPNALKVDMYGNSLLNSDGSERFSRKVFVGGLPPDIDEEEIKASFRKYGSLVVDWPHKAESKSYFPPKGYAFLLFHEESSVQALIDNCFQEDDKLYLCVSSPTIKDKPVQIRPWRLSDADFVLDSTLALDPRKTVFVGGVPRPLKANELANIMNDLYNGVCYAGIDTDLELKYPKGAGRVAFSNHQSYIAAISARFVHLHHSEIEKRVEVKPYVLDDQFCDECQGVKCQNKFAPFFCANIQCLQYYCETCWSTIHSQPGKEFHKPLVKEGADRPRGVPYRWC